MATPTSPQEDVPTSSLPIPTPTHPVAGRSMTDDAPSFEWMPVPDADTYRLQLAASDNFETLYYDDTVDASPATLSLTDVVPDEATVVWWRVRAETGGEDPWSAPAHFERSDEDVREDGQFLVDAPPVPIHPIEGDAVDPAAAGITWEPVPEASGYQLQIAKTETFDDPVVDATVEGTTSLSLFDMLPAEQPVLHWRVRALFPNDTAGPWSETARFGTDAEASPEETVAGEPEGGLSTPSSVEESPIAAGPAQESRTSSGMAVAFVGIVVISFVVTIFLIMYVG